VKRRQKSVKLLETERGPAARTFDEKAGEREQLVVARGIE
jgi:hypothetical protein